MASGGTERRNSNSSGNSIPLLVQGLNGGTRQLDVPTSATVDEVRGLILGHEKDSHNFKLSLGDTELEPGVPLSDTQVISAYSYATSLLEVIGSSRLEPEKTNEALTSVSGVVRSLSSGVRDVNALCAAASRSLEEALQAPSMDINDMFPTNTTEPSVPNGWSDAPSPAALVRKLSKQLPSHFVPEASEDFLRNSMRTEIGGLGLDDTSEFDRLLDATGGTTTSTTGDQPRIADIARLRRANNPSRQNGNNNDANTSGGGALFSTHNNNNNADANVGDLPLDIATQSAAAAASGLGNKHAVMARSGGSTWMEDVISTWSVGLVRSSGALDRTPNGQEIKNHIDAMEKDNENVDRSDDEASPTGESSMDIDSISEHSSVPSQVTTTAPTQQHQQSYEPMNIIAQTQLNSDAQKQATTASIASQSRVSTPPQHLALNALPCAMNASAANRSPNAGTSSSSPSTRRATPIAPSPLPTGFQQTTPAVVLRPPPVKRGRKLKNPDLTPEQRKQMRKEQKRKSARESRIRKKTMEEGYQHKLKMLISENGTLKKQVTDLTHRLQVLQGLLTVTVRPVNHGTLGNQQQSQLSGVQSGGMPGMTGALGGGGAAATMSMSNAATNNVQRRFGAATDFHMMPQSHGQQRQTFGTFHTSAAMGHVPPQRQSFGSVGSAGMVLGQPQLTRSGRTRVFPIPTVPSKP